MSAPKAEVEPEVTEELQESPIVEERDLIAELLELPTKFIKRPCQLATARALVLENKGIGDNEALSLAEALRRGAMPRLEWLRLAHNSIGDLGCEALIVGITGYYEHLIHHFKNMVYVHDGRRIDIQGLDGLKRTGNPTIFILMDMDLSFNRIQAPRVFNISATVGKGSLEIAGFGSQRRQNWRIGEWQHSPHDSPLSFQFNLLNIMGARADLLINNL